MYNPVNYEIFWNNISNLSLFIICLVVFCTLILLRKCLKRKCVVIPKGKAVLITGCDTGFGRQLALRLNSLGYRVYATVLDMNSDDSLSKESENKEQMVVHKMDVTDDKEVNEVYLKIKQNLQIRKHVLWAVVNNAGYGILAQSEWVDLAHYKRIFDVNVFGLIRVTNKFLPLIRESKGRIIILSSVLGLMIQNSFGAYCMTKTAVTVFARTLRRELNKFGIKVSVLYPGGYKNTNFREKLFASVDSIWHQMDDNIKNSYGNQEYLESWKKRHNFSFNYLHSTNTERVVNDMIDAITNSVPKNEYKQVGHLLLDILAKIYWIAPASFIDYYDSF